MLWKGCENICFLEMLGKCCENAVVKIFWIFSKMFLFFVLEAWRKCSANVLDMFCKCFVNVLVNGLLMFC